MKDEISRHKIAVVIPSYKVRNQIISVIRQVGSGVSRIYVVDDCCPDGSGSYVERNCKDPRVVVIRHLVNQGVGGAVITGYKAAIEDGMDIIVKVDGDGQMDPSLIPDFVYPILAGQADYTKGNRFFDLEEIRAMPKERLFGNAILSFITKISSGYWNIFDPTNGYTAIHRDVVHYLPFEKISQRYFFESDILFRLNILRAVVVDIPMDAKYGSEVSSLKISNIVGEFVYKHFRNFGKRIFYSYYLRDMSLASIELPSGLALLLFGIGFGIHHWVRSLHDGVVTPVGTVMIAILPILMGFQLLLAFLSYDISNVPSRPFHRLRRIPRNGKSIQRGKL